MELPLNYLRIFGKKCSTFVKLTIYIKNSLKYLNGKKRVSYDALGVFCIKKSWVCKGGAYVPLSTNVPKFEKCLSEFVYFIRSDVVSSFTNETYERPGHYSFN